MTRRISLIIGIAVAALTVAVPTALAEGRLAGSQEPDGVAFFRANEMATLAGSQEPAGVAFFRANEIATLAEQSTAPVSTYRDAHERSGAVVNQSEPQWMTALKLRSEGLNKQYGLGEFATSSAQNGDVSRISSGRDIEWPKIGIGLGIGIVLILGLILGLKATRNPPLAH